jgi:hypothetical protein
MIGMASIDGKGIGDSITSLKLGSNRSRRRASQREFMVRDYLRIHMY